MNPEFTQQSIDYLCKLSHAIAKSKGFWENPREVGTLLMLIVSELSEALEADRKDLMDDKLTHRKGLEVELADACIRIFDLAESQGFDLGSAIIEKMAFNEKRPHMHGGKKY